MILKMVTCRGCKVPAVLGFLPTIKAALCDHTVSLHPVCCTVLDLKMWPLDGCRTRYIVAIVIAALVFSFFLTSSLRSDHTSNERTSTGVESADLMIVERIQLALYQDKSDFLACLSILGCMATIVACVAIFVTYTCFKSLRSLTGLCLMNWTIALGLSNYSMLLASDGNLPLILSSHDQDPIRNSMSTRHSNSCKAIAVSLHFFVLSRFAWSSVLAVQFLQTVKKNKIENQAKESKRYTMYCVYGWLLPAITCSPALVEELQSNEVYGRLPGTTVCWIIQEETEMAFFLILFGLTLIINLFCFLKFIAFVHLMLQSARAVNSITKHNDVSWTFELKLFIGMFSTLGLTGMLEYLLAVEQLDWLQRPFTLLQILQGPIILFTFILQKAVKSRFAQATRNIQKQILIKAISFVMKLHNRAEIVIINYVGDSVESISTSVW